MKNILIAALFLIAFKSFAQTPQQVENEIAFAKFYGYIKYFYPGDEATKIDWDKFSIYGAKHIESCKTTAALKDSLNNLVKKLMPGVVVKNIEEKYKFNPKPFTPKDLTEYELISWQHLGVGLVKDKANLYKSARTNRPQVFKTAFMGYGTVSVHTNAKVIAGKTFELSGRAKLSSGSGAGHFWFKVENGKEKMGFFDNMDDRPITNKEWTNFSIKGKIDDLAENIGFGAYLSGLGNFLIDDLSVKVEGYEIFSDNFESETVNAEPKSIGFASQNFSDSKGKYSFTVREANGNKYLSLMGPKDEEKSEIINEELFQKHATFGEYIEKPIGSGLKIIVPLALYGTKTHTFPVPDSVQTSSALAKINQSDYILNGSDLYFRLGNTINTWNVFQHFFPYFDVAKTNWGNDLNRAISDCYQDKNDLDYAKTLKKLTAKLKDGHINVWSTSSSKNQYLPPITWKWLENNLVVTGVMDSTLKLRKGDVVEKINGEDVKAYFARVNSYISAATIGLLNHRAQTESLMGEKDTPFNLGLIQGEEIKLSRNMHSSTYYELLPKQDTIKSLGNDITYISISNAKMEAINNALPLLQKSKAIICDLRGYPADNTGLIEYLMVKDDTSSKWMQIPQVIYPDRENIAGYKFERWHLKAKSPHLNAKIFFLIDGQAISYAESYMSFIEHYKLATIIGQPTAGTNGDINTITLPGGYSMWFTGMKVLKHDGSQHHGIGITPNIYVEQTIQGIKENRDEILERAIEEASK
ncbi:S41 family peptidase [Pedobacter miscanthi]|uniref:S41 family peptidase n=1 Tax=Pedobacter miscanthi TaxID=2259170 RepID=UPI002931DC83|nr:S41 family peptidase [Pedobacter miscanthi]